MAPPPSPPLMAWRSCNYRIRQAVALGIGQKRDMDVCISIYRTVSMLARQTGPMTISLSLADLAHAPSPRHWLRSFESAHTTAPSACHCSTVFECHYYMEYALLPPKLLQTRSSRPVLNPDHATLPAPSASAPLIPPTLSPTCPRATVATGLGSGAEYEAC